MASLLGFMCIGFKGKLTEGTRGSLRDVLNEALADATDDYEWRVDAKRGRLTIVLIPPVKAKRRESAPTAQTP